MRKILSGLVGAAMLVGASAASAQDYTWTLSDLWFDRHGPTSPWAATGEGGQASGTLVLTKVGSGYQLKSFSFTTSEGALGYSATYDYAQNDGFATDGFNTFLQIDDIDGEYSLRFTWYDNALADEMDFNQQGASFLLEGGLSYEFMGSQRRYNGTGETRCSFDANFNQTCTEFNAGTMTLSRISQTTVATPEPASMAVLGAGLLGLFAARRVRRKA